MKKRMLNLFFAICMVASLMTGMMPTASAASREKCGEDLTWTLDAGGMLTISGSGEMDNNGMSTPWFLSRKEIKSVTIKNGVTSIGYYAFNNCVNMKSVTIPDSVTSIGALAFLSCNSLTNVMIPSSVTSIGKAAFEKCSSLTNVTISNSVTSIGERAFNECSSLMNVTIPDCVQSVGDNAFSGCSSLTSLTVPRSVTSIGNAAFSRCSSLTDVYYVGTKAQWKKIKTGYLNAALTNAVIHCEDGDLDGEDGDPDKISSVPDGKQTDKTGVPNQKICAKCVGVGTCTHCFGSGRRDCPSNRCAGGICSKCGGSGSYFLSGKLKPCYCTSGYCNTCYGKGYLECNYCSGTGRCNLCNGFGFY